MLLKRHIQGKDERYDACGVKRSQSLTRTYIISDSAFPRKNSIGISKAGSRFRVLQSLMPKMLKPDEMIRIPPTMDISVMNSGLMAVAEIFDTI